jgi:hypothetical protein
MPQSLKPTHESDIFWPKKLDQQALPKPKIVL